MLLLDLGDCRPVCAAHVIGSDLQIRNRIGARRPTEDEIAILLVSVGLLSPLFDLDQPRIDGTSIALERTFELEVTGAEWRLVELPRVVIEELIALAERKGKKSV